MEAIQREQHAACMRELRQSRDYKDSENKLRVLGRIREGSMPHVHSFPHEIQHHQRRQQRPSTSGQYIRTQEGRSDRVLRELVLSTSREPSDERIKTQRGNVVLLD